MPVSYFPLVLPLVFFLILCRGATHGPKALLRSVFVVVALFALVTVPFYVPGWWLMLRSRSNDPSTLYRLSRWHERHAEQIGDLILWPFEPDVASGFACLERAAAQDFPPALYAVGVRLKHGELVPKPPNWTGPAGNHFPQPERGQPLIDKALRLGFKPIVSEELFYTHVFRGLWERDPNG